MDYLEGTMMAKVHKYSDMSKEMKLRPCSSLGWAGNELCWVRASDRWLVFDLQFDKKLGMPTYSEISPYDARRLAKWILEVYGEEEE